MLLVFLSGGLFLGWSLGANDAANVFGTAVGSRMIRFGTAALICSVCVIAGAVIGGSGGAETLGKLGAVNALGGAFTVALAAAVTVFAMTRFSLPVSTSQAVVGAIIGWNFFSHSPTDTGALVKIVLTWVACPLLAAVFGAGLYALMGVLVRRFPLHVLWEDMALRWGLVLAGAFGSYSLGANNIANVMGVFVPVNPFRDFDFGIGVITGVQQLFLLGGVAIAVGVYTYSRRVMMTVGNSLMKLNPTMALVVVLAQSLVLFLFSSQDLNVWLVAHHLPPMPLVPVSSSQAVVGAVLGIGLLRGGRNVQYRVLGEIAAGWVTTPVIAGVISFISLFVLSNVFVVEVVGG